MQGENERQWKKSEREHVRHFLHQKQTTCNTYPKSDVTRDDSQQRLLALHKIKA